MTKKTTKKVITDEMLHYIDVHTISALFIFSW